ncbi:MAG: DsrH/TusB family sulfur metabolism protein [Candidatus Hydrothermarchaeales archaeon]
MEKPEECGDECIIDTQKLLEKKSTGVGEEGTGILIFLTQGTYGLFDDSFNAIQVGNAVLATEENATILLMDEGVYFGVKNQDPSGIELPNNTNYIEDFLELGGRILALRPSLDRRGLIKDDLIGGVEVIDNSQVVNEIEKHKASLTF